MLAFAAVVAGGVWYAVKTFPRVGETDADSVSSQVQPDSGAAAVVRPPSSAGSEPVPPMVDGACGSGRCGVERWAVKTFSDVDRDRVRLDPVDATVESLASMIRPRRLPNARRVGPVEVTVYQVEARIVAWKPEDDGDIHLILAGLQDRSATMIAEIPDPGCSGSCRSGFAERYARARQAFETWVNDPDRSEEAVVIVTGVGFFDRNHGQTGAAPNFIELHPVLSIQFR